MGHREGRGQSVIMCKHIFYSLHFPVGKGGWQYLESFYAPSVVSILTYSLTLLFVSLYLEWVVSKWQFDICLLIWRIGLWFWGLGKETKLNNELCLCCLTMCDLCYKGSHFCHCVGTLNFSLEILNCWKSKCYIAYIIKDGLL
jgi:hypothetical protein